MRARPGLSAYARRIAIEMAFIIFLFYANLLMGQYTHNNVRHLPLLAAIYDIVTPENLAIAVVCAFIGHTFFEALRRRS
jgi:hypothetical protein